MDIRDRFAALASRLPRRVVETPPPPPPSPEDVEAGRLEEWAQDKDTRVEYVAHLDRVIEIEERNMDGYLDNADRLRYHKGRRDALKTERATILKWAGFANKPRPVEVD